MMEIPLVLLIPSKTLVFNTKRQNLKHHNAASREGQGKLTYFLHFPWPPFEAGLSI
jgi:hypothetical protein